MLPNKSKTKTAKQQTKSNKQYLVHHSIIGSKLSATTKEWELIDAVECISNEDMSNADYSNDKEEEEYDGKLNYIAS